MNSLILFIDYFGTLVFAISGILIGVEKKFDLFGVLILGFVTAIGGGTLRDILIGANPVGWLKDEVYIYIIISALPLVYFFKHTIQKWRKSVFIFDTVGIGLFTVLGVQKTLDVELSLTAAVLMGIVSAVFGGILRDVLANEVPLIFRKEIYAFACFIGAVSYIIALSFLDSFVATYIAIAVVILIRLLSIKYGWGLPFKTFRKS